MPEFQQNRSARSLAAAGLAACSLVGIAEQAEAEVVWTPGPTELIGEYRTEAGDYWDTDKPYLEIDFDGDGLKEFDLYYYFGFDIETSRAILNPSSDYNLTTDIVAQDFVAGIYASNMTDWYGEFTSASSLEQVYEQALAFDPLPRGDAAVGSVSVYGLSNTFSERGYVSGVFTGGDGNQYVGYIDLKSIDDSSDDYLLLNGDGVATIYDIGYTQIPEPGSLALLVAPGLLLMRRRRSSNL